MRSIDWKLTRPAQLLWDAMRHAGYPVIVSEGGARSGKTYGAMQVLVWWCHQHPGTRVSVVSRSLPHIKKGAFRDFQVLLRQGVEMAGEMRWTDLTFQFKNGSYIEFFGLEDPDKAHGPGRDILFINEANFIVKDLYDQLAIRTTGQIILDLNPSDFNCWVYDLADDPENYRIHSTYKDNLENLTERQVKQIEKFRDLQDPFKWQVYGLGLRGASEEVVFRGWRLFEDWPPLKDVAYGLDFGYTHPAAMVKVCFYEGDCYVSQVIYASGLTMRELAMMVLAENPGYAPVYADAAEPKSIQELFDLGVNVHPADKDDVWATIMKMKDVNLYIHKDSLDLQRELKGYKWKKDKDDKLIEEPVKANDDLIDASRYCIFTHLNNAYISV